MVSVTGCVPACKTGIHPAYAVQLRSCYLQRQLLRRESIFPGHTGDFNLGLALICLRHFSICLFEYTACPQRAMDQRPHSRLVTVHGSEIISTAFFKKSYTRFIETNSSLPLFLLLLHHNRREDSSIFLAVTGCSMYAFSAVGYSFRSILLSLKVAGWLESADFVKNMFI